MATLSCYYCNKYFPKDQMKRCARCRLVTYCSKECQTFSWKASHKHNCKIHPSLVDPHDPTKVLSKANYPEKYSDAWWDLEIDKSLSRWIQLWRNSFQLWAAMALDLPNHPPNRVVTHCMKLIIEPRHFQEDPAKQYTIVDGAIVPFADILDSHPDLRTTVIDPDDFTRIRFVVLLQNSEGEPRRLRLFQWNDLGLEKWRKIPKNESVELQAGWLDVLKHSIDTMSPSDVGRSFGLKGSSQG